LYILTLNIRSNGEGNIYRITPLSWEYVTNK
jgi:hypothetical protein